MIRPLYPYRSLSPPPSLKADIRIDTRPCCRCGGSMVVEVGGEDCPVQWLCLGCGRRKPYTEKEQ